MSDAVSTRLQEHIINALLLLPYAAFLEVVRQVLSEAGYQNVRAIRRGEERNDFGGIDLLADARSGLVSRPVVIRAKQSIEPVQKRAVHELIGTCIVAGGGHGVIVSTSPFSKAALVAAGSQSIVPLALVGRDELASLMVHHRIGVSDHSGTLSIDRAFFEGLAACADSAQNRARKDKASPNISTLTVSVCWDDRMQ